MPLVCGIFTTLLGARLMGFVFETTNAAAGGGGGGGANVVSDPESPLITP